MISRSASGNYINPETNRQYSRVVGGLAWPLADTEGFLVVVGEDFLLDVALDARPLHLLAEAKAKNLTEMAKLYGEMTETFKAGPWYGRLDKFYCHELSELIPGFSLIPAPHSDDMESAFHYASLIRTLMDPQKKVLRLGAKSRLIRGFFNNVIPKDLTGKADSKPPLAALGYAVSQLQYFKPKKDKSVSSEMSSVNCGGWRG